MIICIPCVYSACGRMQSYNGVIDGCGTWCRCWAINLDPLQEQKVPFTDESLLPLLICLYEKYKAFSIFLSYLKLVVPLKNINFVFVSFLWFLNSHLLLCSCASLYTFTGPTYFYGLLTSFHPFMSFQAVFFYLSVVTSGLCYKSFDILNH